MRAILIFKFTEGAGVVDYSSRGRWLASSQTAPAPKVVLTLMQDAARNAKRSISTILW